MEKQLKRTPKEVIEGFIAFEFPGKNYTEVKNLSDRIVIYLRSLSKEELAVL